MKLSSLTVSASLRLSPKLGESRAPLRPGGLRGFNPSKYSLGLDSLYLVFKEQAPSGAIGEITRKVCDRQGKFTRASGSGVEWREGYANANSFHDAGSVLGLRIFGRGADRRRTADPCHGKGHGERSARAGFGGRRRRDRGAGSERRSSVESREAGRGAQSDPECSRFGREVRDRELLAQSRLPLSRAEPA